MRGGAQVKPTSIEAEWLGFAAICLPDLSPDSVQWVAMRQAFFAGAISIMSAQRDGRLKRSMSSLETEAVGFMADPASFGMERAGGDQ